MVKSQEDVFLLCLPSLGTAYTSKLCTVTTYPICFAACLGFLKHMDCEKFPDGQRQLLSDEGIGQCFFLMCSFPPSLKLRDLRASSRGDLNFGCIFNI